MDAQIDHIKNVFQQYFDYVGTTESPQLYHRWAFLLGMSSVIGRDTWIPFGHHEIHANLYAVLIGAAGTRKSTAITQVKKLLRESGYKNFAADRTSKEKFVADLQTLNHRSDDFDSMMDMEVMELEQQPAELTIAADELQDFMGQNNIDFITMLGVLWDCGEIYENRVKHGKDSSVYNPYVSLLGGSTQTGFSLAFPPEIVTQGFLSRMILVYGERTGRRIAWPTRAYTGHAELQALIRKVHTTKRKGIEVSSGAQKLATDIYAIDYTLDDPRFESYDQRRYTHMLKLALIMSQLRDSDTLEEADILCANTTLHYAEQKMTHALGEFGKSRYADVATSLIEALQRADKPLGLAELWKHVAADLPSQKDLTDIIRSLLTLEKIQQVQLKEGTCFSPKHKKVNTKGSKYVLDNFIPEAELNYDI